MLAVPVRVVFWCAFVLTSTMDRRLLIVAGGMVLVVLAVVGIGSHDGQRVLVIGDSITAQSQDHIRFELTVDRWAPLVEGHPATTILYHGADTNWPMRVAQLVAGQHFGAAIIELGTNDRTSSDALAAGIDAVMRPLRTIPRVIWLNVQEIPFDPDATVVNEALRVATVRWPNLEILDMNRHFVGHGEWHADIIHFNDAGQAELARFIRRALDAPPSRFGILSPIL